MRSLSANCWEGLACQLAQIPGFGPVAVRKWTARGIDTVKAVTKLDFQGMERIASRNPPFGRNLSKLLEDFPRLHLDATLHEPSQSGGPQDAILVTIHARLHHSTPKKAPTWNKKVPAVSFIVTTSSGDLAFAWRGNISKIDYDSGLPLKISVPLTQSSQAITCSLSCEEIVGTEVVAVLESQLPVAAFTMKAADRTAILASGNHKDKKTITDASYDDVADEDLLAALVTFDGLRQNDVHSKATDDFGTDDFPHIDDILGEEKPTSTFEPEKMDNGKWMCNHVCRNKGLTKSGKPCSHKCCTEGLDRPRAPPQPKRSGNDSKNDTAKNASEKVKGADCPKVDKGESDAHSGLALTKTKKHLRDDIHVNSIDDPPCKVPKTMRASEFECIDLSMFSEDELNDAPSSFKKKTLSSAQKGKKKISELHRRVAGAAKESPRLTKTYRANETRTVGTKDMASVRATRSPTLDSALGYISDTIDDDLPETADILKMMERVETTPCIDPYATLACRGDSYNADTVEEARLPSTMPSLSPDTCDTLSPDIFLEKPHLASTVSTVQKEGECMPASMSDAELSGGADFVPDSTPLFFGDPFEVCVDPKDVTVERSLPTSTSDPNWVATMDPELIESLRDVVNFVD